MSVFLISTFFSVQSLFSQENTTTDKEKEDKLQQSIILQKKAMADQMKAQEQQAKDFEIRRDSVKVLY